MYIKFQDKTSFKTVIVNDNINIDIDENKNLVGIDIHAIASQFNWNSSGLNNVR